MRHFRNLLGNSERGDLLRAANIGIALILLATLAGSFIAYKTFRAHQLVNELADTNSEYLLVWRDIGEQVDYLIDIRHSFNEGEGGLLIERVQERLRELLSRRDALDQRYRYSLESYSRATWPANAITDEEFEILKRDVPEKLIQRAREASEVSQAIVGTGFSHWEISTLVTFKSNKIIFVPSERQELLSTLVNDSMTTLRKLLSMLVGVLFAATSFVWLALFRPATKRLSEAREELGMILDTIPALVATYSQTGELHTSNRAYLERWGHTKKGCHVSEVVGPDVWPRIKQKFEKALNGERLNFDMTVPTADGVRMQNAQYVPFRNESGQVSRLVVMISDVQDRYDSARALRESEKKLRTTLNSIGDAVISTDVHGKIVQMNPVACRMTGWSVSEALNQPLDSVFRIVNRDTRKDVESPVNEVLETGSIVRLANRSVLISRSGREYDIRESGAPILSDENEIVGVVLVFRDTTEEIALNERVVDGEKMRAIGQLAGGIAHDVNNQLAIIQGYAELMEHKNQNGEFAKDLEQITATCDQAAGLIDNLITFSQQKSEISQPIDIKDVISATLNILRNTIDRRITLLLKVLTNNTTVSCNAAMLQSAFLNIALNAIQAMPGVGTLTISMDQVAIGSSVDSKFSHLHLSTGRFLSIVFRDTGPGIPTEYLPRVFEPYFSTKQLGSDNSGGRGLGLAMVYGAVRESGGAVYAENAAEGGAIITIMLPLMEQQELQNVETPAVVEVSHFSQMRILMVEDEKQLREISQQMLANIGCKVVLSEDGESALRIFGETPYDFDLVILDLNLPRISGLELLEEFKKIRPEVTAVIATGFPGEVYAQKESDSAIFAILRKPYSFSELSKILQQFAESNNIL